MLRWTVRAIGRLIALLFLVTLPVYILPFTNGLIEGVFFADMAARRASDTLRQVRHDITTARLMDTASVPGAPRIHDTGLPPYHVVQLRDPTDWWKRLGLTRFDVGRWGLSLEASGAERVRDAAALLDTLYRRKNSFENGAPWHAWVYASAQPARAEGHFLDAWDEAFDQLLRYHYARPTPFNAAFHYLSCPGRSFCDLWFIEGPALLHFTTESSEEEDAYLPRQHIPGYDPVTVRVVEFPISDPNELPLSPGVFPSPFDQLRSVTASDTAWQIFDPYSQLTQSLRRLFALCEVKEKTRPQTYGRLVRLEEYWVRKIGLYDDEFWHQLPRLSGIAVSSLAKNKAIDPLWRLVKRYVGRISKTNVEKDKSSHQASSEEDVLQAALRPAQEDWFAEAVRKQVDAMPEDARALLMSSGEDNEAARALLDLYSKANGKTSESGNGAQVEQ